MSTLLVTYIKAILAGIAIGIGGMAFISVRGGALGAFLFSIGLLSVFIGDFYLFTGKVSSIVRRQQIPWILMILFGNFFGATLMGILYRLIASPDSIEFAVDICNAKLLEGWRVIPLGALCNMLIYIATLFYDVPAEKQMRSVVGMRINLENPIPVILCVMVFILSGFEHSIANMFYFAAASSSLRGLDVLQYLGLNILGNAIGGILIFRLHRAGKEK